MEILQTNQAQVTILKLRGRLDTLASKTLQEKIAEVTNSNENHLLIDFADLDFISSSGLRILLSTAKQMKSLKRKLALSSLKNRVKEVFDIAGFTMLFSIYPTEEEAISAL